MKPNYVTEDMEWYEDGYTMEELEKLAKEERANRPTVHIPITAQENWKDLKISKLTQEISANNEYIKELEDEINPIKNENTKLKEEIEKYKNEHEEFLQKQKEFNNEYSREVQLTLAKDKKYLAQNTKIDALEKQVEQLTSMRDHLLTKLWKYEKLD